jgi:hypothetical protein
MSFGSINENLFPAVRLDRGLLRSMIERRSGVIVFTLAHEPTNRQSTPHLGSALSLGMLLT